MMEQDQVLILKLEAFIRKYYKNQLLRGLLFTLLLLGVFFTMLVVLEYYFHFKPIVRAFLFFLFSGILFISIVSLIAIPILKILKIGKILSHEQAAWIVGEHFPEIQDKLLNTIQLIQEKKANPEHLDLVIAGIEQKIKYLKIFNFGKIIDFRKTMGFIRFVLPVFLILLFLGLFFPEIITGPAKRIVFFNKAFSSPLPFRLIMITKSFKAIQQEDFEIKVEVKGQKIPGELFLHYGGITVRMKKAKPTQFSYLFKSLQADVNFFFRTENFQSETFEIKVYPKPVISHFDLSIDFPSYIRREKEKIENSVDLTVPEGSEITWNIFTKDAENVFFSLPEGKTPAGKNSETHFSLKRKISETISYSIIPENRFVSANDSFPGRITVIRDAFPSITFNENQDSSLILDVFFRGVIKDDYGFSKLLFKYEVMGNADTLVLKNESIVLPVNKELTSQAFFFNYRFDNSVLSPGETVWYYFEIWDNDGIHGAKCTKSEMRKFRTLSVDEIIDNTLKKSEKVETGIEKSLSESKAIKKSLDDFNKKKTEKSEVSWQEKKKAENLIRSFEKISDQIEKVSRENLQNIKNEQEYLKTGKRIVEKQESLNKLMRELLSEELKKDIQEMKKLLDQMDKKKLDQLIEKMKVSNKELENQLDRALELYKKIEFERKLEQAISGLKEIARKQDSLAGITEKSGKELDKIIKEQEEIKNEYDTLQKALKKLESDGKNMEDVPNLSETGKHREQISDQIENSKTLLKNSKKAGAAKSQHETADGMNKLAERLEELQNEAEDTQSAENAEDLRRILEDLVRLSFDQEALIYEAGKINRNDPKFQVLITRQREMKDKVKSVEDSLRELSKRELFIQPFISRELLNIETSMTKAVDQLNERNISEATVSQQFNMTAINNLAVLLSEALKSMNMQPNSSGKSGKSCKKPSSKGGGKKMKGMKDLQNQISEQMKKMKEGMEKGKQEGKGMGQDGGSFNEQIARLAAQQEALRREMENYQQGLQKGSKSENENMNALINEMSENERDLLYKKLSQESMQRQQRILSRLLEAEKAEETRDFDEKREAERVKSEKFGNPNGKIKYNHNDVREEELLNRTQLPVKGFYRNKINMYLIKIQ